MKNSIDITVFVPVAEPYDEEDGLTLSVDRVGEITLTPQFHSYDGRPSEHGVFDERTLRSAFDRLANAFANAKSALEES